MDNIVNLNACRFSSGLTLLMKGVDGNDHCPWCHYLSCVPSPLWTCEARCTVSNILGKIHKLRTIKFLFLTNLDNL